MDERIKDGGGDADVCVIGGGIAGLVFARRAGRSVLMLDDAPAGDDGKSVVIGAETADALAALSALPQNSRPLRRARISFSGGGGGVVGEERTAPFAYGIDHKAVQAALRDGVQIWKTRAKSVVPTEGGGVLVTTADGRTVRAALVVVACPLSFLPPPFVTSRYAYAQSVLSLTAKIVEQADGAAAAAGIAEQRFTRMGMFVLVPRPDGDVGVIASAPASVVGELNAMSDETLSVYLSAEFNLHLQTGGRRVVYAPQLVRTRPLFANNIALLGGGATLLHPAGARSVDFGVGDALYLAAQTAAGKLPDARRRLPAHCAAAALTSALALGAHCRAAPLRLAGGGLFSLFGKPLARAIAFSAGRGGAGRGGAAFGADAGSVRQ